MENWDGININFKIDFWCGGKNFLIIIRKDVNDIN